MSWKSDEVLPGAVTGPSGAGKGTLIAALKGLSG